MCNDRNEDSLSAILEKMEQEGTLMEWIDNFINDERIPELPAHKYLTKKQWDALTENIPMTQDMFDRILQVCQMTGDAVTFQRTIEQFPDLEVKFSDELREKYKKEHDAYKAAYLERFGDDAIMFLD